MEKPNENIVLASDHNGVELKRIIYTQLNKKGYRCIDLGPYDTNRSVDYVDYAEQLGQIVHQGDVPKGILICGTGVGMSIVANRFQNVRAALIHNLESAQKSREHNDSNVLCLGAWVTPLEINKKIIDEWLGTTFGEGRHVRRIEKLAYHRPGKIVFAHGVFDVLHSGHVDLLKFSKSLGSRLIVGISSDRAARELKGPDRPINSQEDRKKILDSLQEVDEVVIVDDVEIIDVLRKVSPDVVVKGGEWSAEEVRRRDSIPDNVEIKMFPLVQGYSTTQILKKVREKETWEKRPANI